MKNITTAAVLMSLVMMAGLAATDAYAQVSSNTQRLMDIDAATQDIMETVDSISEETSGLGDALMALQEVVSGIPDTLTEILSAVMGVQTSVDDVSMGVTDMKTQLDNVEMINANVDARLNNIESSIAAIQATGGSSAETEQRIAILTNIATENSNRLDNLVLQLASIQAGLESLGADIKAVQSTPRSTNPGNILIEGESELEVNSWHYFKHGDPTTSIAAHYYELDMTFSCNNDVFISSADLLPELRASTGVDNENRYLYREITSVGGGTDPSATTLNNYVKIDNRDLFNNKFNPTANTYSVFDQPALFNNKPLKAGERIKIESVLYEGVYFRTNASDSADRTKLVTASDVDEATANSLPPNIKNSGTLPPTSNLYEYLIYDSTKEVNRPLYDIQVEWFTYESGTTCSIGFGAGGITPGLSKTSTLSYGVSVDPEHAEDDNKVLKDYKDEIDCSGDPIEITKISAGTADDWRLANFAKLFLEIGDEKYPLRFDASSGVDQPVLVDTDDILPLAVGNDDLVISGTIPVKNLLLTLTYNTVADGECTYMSGYDS